MRRLCPNVSLHVLSFASAERSPKGTDVAQETALPRREHNTDLDPVRPIAQVSLMYAARPRHWFISLEGEDRSRSGTNSTSYVRFRTYLVSSPINAYYYTQLVGDAKNPPILLASNSFEGMAVIGTRYQHERY